MLQPYRISLSRLFYLVLLHIISMYHACLCKFYIVNTMYHYISTVQPDGVIEAIYVFTRHVEKHDCVSSSDKNRTCVGQVCGFLYLFVRKLHACGFTHAMHDAPETKASPRNKAVCGPPRAQLDVSIIFHAYLRLDYKALGRPVYAGYSLTGINYCIIQRTELTTCCCVLPSARQCRRCRAKGTFVS